MHYPKAVILMLFLLGSLIRVSSLEHQVQKGETIYSLARFYSVSVQEILRVNKLSSSDTLAVDMKLVIPSSNNKAASDIQGKTGYTTYIVQSGDTFYSIARELDMSVASLLAVNGLEANSLLHQGQVLVVNKIDSEPSTDIPSNPDKYWPIGGSKEALRGQIQGVNISGVSGQLIYGVRRGTVLWSGAYRDFKNVVLVMSPEGYIYFYGGVGHVFVNKGQEVAAGEPLAKLAASAENEAKLAFSVFRNGEYLEVEKAPRG